MPEYNQADQKLLLDLAKESIQFGLEHNTCIDVELSKYPPHLQEERACFVTLHINDQLRGCIGSLLAHRPLVSDVANNAYNAAFSDPRFFPLTMDEFKQIDLEISILSVPKKIDFTSEQDLLSKIRPKVDGLILTSGWHKGTFLPSVWDELKDPVTFLKHLKMKAGLDADFWDDSIEVERYTAQIIK